MCLKKQLTIQYFLWLLLFIDFNSYGQASLINFRKYSTKEYLSSATVYDILKDRQGFVWIATEDGLNRFDGTSFKIYRNEPGNPNSLPVNYITALHESPDGNIWIGTSEGGLSYYDRQKDAIFLYKAEGQQLAGAAISNLKADQSGNIWVTGFGSLQIIDPKTKLLITQKKFAPIGRDLSNKVTIDFLQDRNKNYWISTDKGLYLYNSQLKLLNIYKHNENDPSSFPAIRAGEIKEDKNGTIWIATYKGLVAIPPDSTGFQIINTTSKPAKINSNIVFALEVDQNNRLWIGTEEGLNVLDIGTKSVLSLTPDQRNPASISGRSIRSIYITNKGSYWIGTFRNGVNLYNENLSNFNRIGYNAFDPFGLRSPVVTSLAAKNNNEIFVGTDDGGLHIFNRLSGLINHLPISYNTKNSNHPPGILSLEIGRDNQLWIGTYLTGLYSYNHSTGATRHFSQGNSLTNLNSNDIFCLKEDSKGNIWAGTNGGGINIIRPGTGNIDKYVSDPLRPSDPVLPSSNYIRAFEEDQTGKMWIGTYGSGISVFNPSNQQFSFYSRENSGLPSNFIIALKEDRKGNIWIGTNGNGMAVLKKGNTKFEIITEKDGLANGIINHIIEDESGKLWISTNKGISYYDPETKLFKNYSNYNGLQPGAFLPRSGTITPDGYLFFGGQEGFNYFNPASLTTNKNIPQVVITELIIDNKAATPLKDGPITKSILLTEEIQLKYKQAFSIGFAALDFTAPEANQYKYKLEGFDKDWVSAGKDHSAYYGSIPPGNYVFKVKASNNDGIWNEKGKSVKILVDPPFWRTNLAYLAYALSIIFILFYTRKQSIKKIQMRFAIEQERKNAREMLERERREADYLHNLDQMKIKFITNLSHEFKTPVSLILGPVDNLIKQIQDKAPLNQLNLIKRNTKRLLNLVNQLLDFRKLEEGEIKLQASEGDIVPFLKEVCDFFTDLALRKKIEFGFYSNIPSLHLHFDHNKIERVLFNLLSNAFKFTPENGNIAVNMEQQIIEEEGIGQITVSVKDSGIGIPKEVQDRIFESFFQYDAGSEILNQGTGIGLAIAKEFVNIHNGKLWVKSEPGKGSTFTFSLKLPLAIKPEQDLPDDNYLLNEHQNEQEMYQNSSQPAVLIVEDDDDFRYYIKDGLNPNYRIFEAINGKEAWHRILFHHPDIVVCDIHMPIMNGIELVQKIKADKRTKHIPVILLTAATPPNGLLDGLEIGAIDYMTKPFDFAVLQAKINSILLLNQSFKDTYSKQVTLSLPETEMVSEKDRFIQKTLAYIYENIDNPQLSVEILSTHMNISRASLYNKLFDYTGMSPIEFIRSVKLDKAKDLLEKTDKNISEIAYESGFANPNYFTKVFKNKFNVTPSEYHASIKGKE